MSCWIVLFVLLVGTKGLLLEKLLDAAEGGEDARGFVGEVDGLVVLARSHLLEGLEVAHGDEVLGRVGSRALDSQGDLADGLGFCFGGEELGFCFGLSTQDLSLTLPFGVVNRLLHAPFGLTDGGFLLPFGVEDLGTLVTLGTHLFLHGITDVAWGIDVLELDAVDLHAPLVRGFVEDDTELVVDGVTAGEGLIEVHLPDDVTQARLGELLDGVGEVLDFVDRAHGVDDLEVEDGVDLGDDIILRDDALAREVIDSLTQIDVRDVGEAHEGLSVGPWDGVSPAHGARAVDEGDDDVHARGEGAVVLTESLDDDGLRLLYDAEPLVDGEDDQEGDDQWDDEFDRHKSRGLVKRFDVENQAVVADDADGAACLEWGGALRCGAPAVAIDSDATALLPCGDIFGDQSVATYEGFHPGLRFARGEPPCHQGLE